MKEQWQHSHRELCTELKMAYDQAVNQFPERVSEIDAVFAVADNLRICIIRVDHIAFKPTPHGPLSVDEIDELHSILHSNTETLDSLSDHSKALFTWREHAVEWRGHQNSNIVEAIQDEALQYSLILHKCSLRIPFAPVSQSRELHSEPWFDIPGVQDVASCIRERIPLKSARTEPTGGNPSGTGAAAAAATSVATRPAGQRKRRIKPRMPKAKVEAHWREVLNSENRDLIQEYLTLGEIALANKIGTSRGTLRKCECFKKRKAELQRFNREHGSPRRR